MRVNICLILCGKYLAEQINSKILEDIMKNLTKNDCEKYLQYGNLTQPFLEKEYVLNKVLIDYNHKIKENKNYTKIDALYNWIHHCMDEKPQQEEKNNVKFRRTAKEIWESGFASGCTDYATLFATFARQIGIPTTLLHTAEYNWVRGLQNNENQPLHVGHSFCECFYEDRWVLVDPTFRKIEKKYNSDKITLSYQVSKSNIYIPYFRGLDLGKKQSVREHNEIMDKECIGLQL